MALLDALVQRRPSRRSIIGVSTAETDWSLRKACFRLADFFSRMCDFMPCRRISLPVPVILKRFLAPEWVFCLGIFESGWSDRGLGLRLRLGGGPRIALRLGAGDFGCLDFGCLGFGCGCCCFVDRRLGRRRLAALVAHVRSAAFFIAAL